MESNRKAVWGWVMYDWANSAFATTVMAGFFPIFLKQYWSYGADVNVSTAQLGFGNSIASLFVALIAPILGAIADKGSAKKKFLIFFAYLGVLMTAALFLVQKGQWAWAIFIYAMGIIGFSGANIFYDSLLPSVAGEEKIDYVSGLGFSMGYLGGGLLFLINVLMTLMPQKFGLPDAATAVRFAFLSVALWWGLFTFFTIFWVPEKKVSALQKKGESIFTAGFRQLAGTFKNRRSRYDHSNGSRLRSFARISIKRFNCCPADRAVYWIPGSAYLRQIRRALECAQVHLSGHFYLYGRNHMGYDDDPENRVLYFGRSHRPCARGYPGPQSFLLCAPNSQKSGGGILWVLQHVGKAGRYFGPGPDGTRRTDCQTDPYAGFPYPCPGDCRRTAGFPLGHRFHFNSLCYRSDSFLFCG
jgi:MFS family permease